MPTTPPVGIIPLSDTSSSNPIISSAFSSTFSDWASKVLNNGDDKATRQLLGQLARVMPLPTNSSSSTAMDSNVAFKSAQREAIRGLKKVRDAEPSSSEVPSVRTRANTKTKGKVVLTSLNHYKTHFRCYRQRC